VYRAGEAAPQGIALRSRNWLPIRWRDSSISTTVLSAPSKLGNAVGQSVLTTTRAFTDTAVRAPTILRGVPARYFYLRATSVVQRMEVHMNEDKIKGQWKQLAGKLKTKWGKLTDDDLRIAEGDSEYLAGKIQQRYGVARDEAHKQVKEFGRSL
jgi:uncharacterized protein YjbJ (UPF0337 family)